jgi:hypothetical protein
MTRTSYPTDYKGTVKPFHTPGEELGRMPKYARTWVQRYTRSTCEDADLMRFTVTQSHWQGNAEPVVAASDTRPKQIATKQMSNTTGNNSLVGQNIDDNWLIGIGTIACPSVHPVTIQPIKMARDGSSISLLHGGMRRLLEPRNSLRAYRSKSVLEDFAYVIHSSS